jgi:hypothetical protein
MEFKNKIEDEPGMEIYVENTDNLIEKLKTFICECLINENAKKKGKILGQITFYIGGFLSLDVKI